MKVFIFLSVTYQSNVEAIPGAIHHSVAQVLKVAIRMGGLTYLC